MRQRLRERCERRVSNAEGRSGAMEEGVPEVVELVVRGGERRVIDRSVTELRLDGNQLTALPESFGGLASLAELGLGNNQLTALPESFGGLASLT